jgi:hypothetical protein
MMDIVRRSLRSNGRENEVGMPPPAGRETDLRQLSIDHHARAAGTPHAVGGKVTFTNAPESLVSACRGFVRTSARFLVRGLRVR